VLSDDGHVLPVKHRKLGSWSYPGGHIYPNEDPAQAVLREVTEELGLSARSLPKPGSATPASTVLLAPFIIRIQDITADAMSGPRLIEKQPIRSRSPRVG
jgi:8-oxo-dGTP diphosphatase